MRSTPKPYTHQHYSLLTLSTPHQLRIRIGVRVWILVVWDNFSILALNIQPGLVLVFLCVTLICNSQSIFALGCEAAHNVAEGATEVEGGAEQQSQEDRRAGEVGGEDETVGTRGA